MNELEDIKLKALIQEVKLESPESNFSVRVMNKIFDEDNVLESIKSQRILGTGFWIILLLFISLLAVLFLMSDSAAQNNQLQSVLPQLNSGVSADYKSFLEKLGSLPLSIAGIMVASSILLFLERFITSNSRVFS